MACSAFSAPFRTVSRALPQIRPQQHQQIRHASLLRRPKRPYTFTQLITLSDGSSFFQRTTSPTPVYNSTKDNRNTVLWNPSSQKLLNVEEDEAGKLRRFRKRFGRGWDAEATESDAPEASGEDSLMDLLAEFNNQQGDGGKGKKE